MSCAHTHAEGASRERKPLWGWQTALPHVLAVRRGLSLQKWDTHSRRLHTQLPPHHTHPQATLLQHAWTLYDLTVWSKQQAQEEVNTRGSHTARCIRHVTSSHMGICQRHHLQGGPHLLKCSCVSCTPCSWLSGSRPDSLEHVILVELSPKQCHIPLHTCLQCLHILLTAQLVCPATIETELTLSPPSATALMSRLHQLLHTKQPPYLWA